jgi:hypothetical protein
VTEDPPAVETSAAPSSTAAADPPPSGSCTTGDIDCVDGQFAQCVDGTFVLTSCPSGTTCTKIPIDNGNVVITCDYVQSSKPRRKDKRHTHARKHVLVGPAHGGSQFS